MALEDYARGALAALGEMEGEEMVENMVEKMERMELSE
jgi:hypothetical protein